MDEKTKEEINQKIIDFKSEMFKKYNKRIYCYYKKAISAKEQIKLPELWGIFVDYIENNHPKYMDYITFEDQTRKRTWITICQCFHYIAYKDLGYSKSDIARFINKHHATVIHSINSASNYLDDEDPIFMEIYSTVYKKYKEYVGIISENTKV